MDIDFIKLGQRVRALRQARNLTIAQLSEKVDKTESFIGNIERGEGAPAIQTLADLANALNTGVDILLQDSLSVFNKTNENLDYQEQIKLKLQIFSAEDHKDILIFLDMMKRLKSR